LILSFSLFHFLRTDGTRNVPEKNYLYPEYFFIYLKNIQFPTHIFERYRIMLDKHTVLFQLKFLHDIFQGSLFRMKMCINLLAPIIKSKNMDVFQECDKPDTITGIRRITWPSATSIRSYVKPDQKLSNLSSSHLPNPKRLHVSWTSKESSVILVWPKIEMSVYTL